MLLKMAIHMSIHMSTVLFVLVGGKGIPRQFVHEREDHIPHVREKAFLDIFFTKEKSTKPPIRRSGLSVNTGSH